MKQKQNPLNKLCSSWYEKSNRETLLSNELNATNNRKMIVECDKDKTSNNNNTKNREDVPEEESYTKTLSVQSSVKVSKLFPLVIRNKNVLTQGIATTVALNNNKYSNSMLQNKECMLKRRTFKCLEVPYIINDVYINEYGYGYFFDISNSNGISKIKTETEIPLTFDAWNIYRPCTQPYLEISGLYVTCYYRNMIYNCSILANISVSVTLQTKLMAGLVSHIGKIRAVYYDID